MQYLRLIKFSTILGLIFGGAEILTGDDFLQRIAALDFFCPLFHVYE